MKTKTSIIDIFLTNLPLIFSAILLGLSRLPIHTGFFVFFAFIPFFFFFNKRNYQKKELIFSGILFSVTYTSTALYWINLVTIFGFIGLYILFSFYFSILFIIIQKIWKSFPKLKYLIFSFLIISFEYLQNFGELRFPWMNSAYSLSEYFHLIQIADIGGVYLITLLIIITNILIYHLQRSFKKYFSFLLIFFTLWISYGFFRIKYLPIEKHNLKVAIVQASIPQELKWESSYKDSSRKLYEKYTSLSAENGAKLVIWPEAAFTSYLLKRTKEQRYLRNLVSKNNISLFTGFPDYQKAKKNSIEDYYFYNACTLINNNGKIDKPYYKKILVPFGERIPWLNIFPVLWHLQLGQANFEYGKETKIYSINGLKFSPQICFETAFPSLTLQMADLDADFIVNLTNDAWFYYSAGTFQHSKMSVFRAIEIRKQFFRAANTGYSLIISPSGKIDKSTNLFEKTIISDEVKVYTGTTLYVKFFRNFPLWIFCISIIFIILSIFRTGINLLSWKK